MEMDSKDSARLALVLASAVLCGIALRPAGGHLYNNRYAGDQVVRVTPHTTEDVRVVKRLFENLKVDLWRPNSLTLIQADSDVDVHIGHGDIRELKGRLKGAHIYHRVLISNLQKEIEKQLAVRSTRKRRSDFQYDYEVYHSLDEIKSWMFEMNRTHPHVVDMFSIGRSYEGRPLYILQLGKRTHPYKKAVWMDCGVHAREWIGPAFCQWFVKEALNSYRTDPVMRRLMNHLNFYIMPVFNVDGYHYSWTTVTCFPCRNVQDAVIRI